MNIDCYLSIDCSSEDLLRENLDRALELERIEAEVNFQRIDEATAEEMGFKGSPAIIIDGVDVLPGDASGFS